MTRAQLRTLVSELQEQMVLGDWHIEIDFDRAAPGRGTEADVTRAPYYDTAILRLGKGWAKWPESKMMHLIAHELGHLLTRDLEEAVLDLKDFFGVLSTWQMFHKRYLHEIEGVVDRYASAIAGKGAGA